MFSYGWLIIKLSDKCLRMILNTPDGIDPQFVYQAEQELRRRRSSRYTIDVSQDVYESTKIGSDFKR